MIAMVGAESRRVLAMGVVVYDPATGAGCLVRDGSGCAPQRDPIAAVRWTQLRRCALRTSTSCLTTAMWRQPGAGAAMVRAARAIGRQVPAGAPTEARGCRLSAASRSCPPRTRQLRAGRIRDAAAVGPARAGAARTTPLAMRPTVRVARRCRQRPHLAHRLRHGGLVRRRTTAVRRPGRCRRASQPVRSGHRVASRCAAAFLDSQRHVRMCPARATVVAAVPSGARPHSGRAPLPFLGAGAVLQEKVG